MALNARYRGGLLYPIQYGQGAVFFKAKTVRHSGNGLGGFFKAVARNFLPFARQYLVPFAKQHVVPHAMHAARNVVNDVVEGASLRESLKNRGKTALKDGLSSALNQSGSGRSRKRKAKSSSKSVKRSKLSLFVPKVTPRLGLQYGTGQKRKAKRVKRTKRTIFEQYQ